MVYFIVPKTQNYSRDFIRTSNIDLFESLITEKKFIDTVKDFKTSALFNVYILISIGLPIGITLVWQSVGSAFGMRYIYAVLPISFVTYMSLSQKQNLKILNVYTIIFSSLSFL